MGSAILSVSRVKLGLHVQLPARMEMVLQTRSNFQHRRLTVANPELRTKKELTLLITNDNHTEQRISRKACVAWALLHRILPQEESAVHHGSRLDLPRLLKSRGESCGSWTS